VPGDEAGISEAPGRLMRRLLQSIRRDIRAARERDPAATSDLEILLVYPGFHARQLHRLAHALQRRGIPILPRLISHLNRGLTGIEIHPGARIGEGFFIDHGMGVVIGETAEIGDDVTLYQGVSLAGTSRLREKRHPTLHDGVMVGAGSVVVKTVPPYSTVVGVPGRTVAVRFPDNRTLARLPDPEADEFQLLEEQIRELEERLVDLERRLPPASGDQAPAERTRKPRPHRDPWW
jgi:serine O-acetyltransferase